MHSICRCLFDTLTYGEYISRARARARCRAVSEMHFVNFPAEPARFSTSASEHAGRASGRAGGRASGRVGARARFTDKIARDSRVLLLL